MILHWSGVWETCFKGLQLVNQSLIIRFFPNVLSVILSQPAVTYFLRNQAQGVALLCVIWADCIALWSTHSDTTLHIMDWHCFSVQCHKKPGCCWISDKEYTVCFWGQFCAYSYINYITFLSEMHLIISVISFIVYQLKIIEKC